MVRWCVRVYPPLWNNLENRNNVGKRLMVCVGSFLHSQSLFVSKLFLTVFPIGLLLLSLVSSAVWFLFVVGCMVANVVTWNENDYFSLWITTKCYIYIYTYRTTHSLSNKNVVQGIKTVGNVAVPGLKNGMDYIQLGDSDLIVSKVCMGTVREMW